MTSSFERQPYYCEENVWRLVQRDDVRALPDVEVWVLAASGPAFAMWQQKAGQGPDGFIVWDYHVVACADVDGVPCVIDVDTRLDVVTPACTYLQTCLLPVPDEVQAMVRVVPAAAYVDGLVSDRSHMRDDDGQWQAPPPSWPSPSHVGSNVLRLADPTWTGLGQLATLQEMWERLACSSSTPPTP